MKRATRKTLRGRRTGEQGFTLLETLVALVIISLALGMAVQSVALASSRIVASREARQIERYARGLLANPPSQAGRTVEGDRRSGMQAVIEVAPVAEIETRQVSLVTVTITTRGSRGQSHRFRTISIGGDSE
jgi:prepilin-type N-terminal cleavage/methylation domain-containing protein